MASFGSSGLVTVSEHPDVRIFYQISSQDFEKPVIVLSHSLSAATWLWESFVEEFSRQATIIRYDIRFHGQSPLSRTEDFDYNSGHSIEDLAFDVVKLLNHLKIPQAEAFIGLSIGGGIGVVLAANHSNRFRRIVTVGSRATVSLGDGDIWKERILLAHEEGMPTLAQQSVERWFNPEWRAANPRLAADIAERVGSQSLHGYVASIAALEKLDLLPHTDTIKNNGDGGQILFVAGEDDALPVVEETKAMAARAGSQVELVKGAGHITHIEQPGAFFSIVRRYLGVS